MHMPDSQASLKNEQTNSRNENLTSREAHGARGGGPLAKW